MARDVAAAGSPAQNPYFDKLYKLIPTEITGAYLAITSMIGSNGTTNGDLNYFYTILFTFLALLFLTPIYTYKVQGVRNTTQIILSTISFPIWVSNISATYLSHVIGVNTGLFSGAVLIVWTLVVPLFAKE